MKITERSHYGLRAMVDLAQNSTHGPVSVKEISEREGIPLRYLEQVLNRLKKGRLVKGVRGPGGGYVLARSPESITARDVLAAVEDSSTGDVVNIDCTGARTGEGRLCCEESCLSKRVWVTLALRVDEVLRQFSLADLIEGVDVEEATR